MKFIKIGAAAIVFLSMAASSFITVNAEDTTTENTTGTSQEINVEASGNDEVVSENNENTAEESVDLDTILSTENNTDNNQSATQQSSMLKAVNQYGFDEEFFKWLQDHGSLPKTGTITQADLDKVTRIDHIINAPFSSLEGIEQLKNLNFLRINSSANISYEELNRLSGLTNLRTLEVGYSKLMTDISPVANLPQLTTLNWYDNGGYVIDFTYYSGEPLDISVLDGQLPNIESLSITEIPLLGTEALASFTTAKKVALWSTGIKDISFINAMPNLTELDVRYDRVTDLSLVAARPGVKTYAGGQLIVLYGNEGLYADLSAASTFTTSMYFKVQDNQYATLTGLSTDKGAYDNKETITWTDITADDLLGITYRDPFAMQKVPLKTIASQFSASSLPANILSYSGTIYQSVSQKIEVEKPTIDVIYEDEDVLTGIAPANATVDVTCPHGNTIRVTADASGNWSMPTDGAIFKDDMFTAVTVHASGQTSDAAEQVVLPVVYTIDASDVTMTVTQLQTLRNNGTLESYVLNQAGAAALKSSRTTKSMEVHGDMTPLDNVNEATIVQVTTYVPADNTVTRYDATTTATIVEKPINVTVIDDTNNGNGSLPNTGQDQMTPVLVGGAVVVIVGIALSRRNNKQRK
ncbi:Ig-like domain-containing protein [Culicoidibacter larvae]|uniref:LPXTG cell wall anchor domain-containing protein n=1 Tax=Culicoidibacter larvae TaxID=2579976 RepID=A0A5R8QBJ0_9FIRM|nr:Ig-like domain-containing protein [Culicoidibacter larvae]TLG73895.1 LPXTG cell wall anchor domain-containing protein [Culicoidibacter larvae]